MGRSSTGGFNVEEIVPQRRFVEPQEVAKLVKYLISEDARAITGQSINVCAGLSVGI
jgi:NAD(P)-dependent dehydrogenase (short-subunit alcohol dehydrogenase family)